MYPPPDPSVYEGKTVDECFESLNYGMRICFVPPHGIFENDIENVKLIAELFDGEDSRKHKAFDLSRSLTYATSPEYD